MVVVLPTPLTPTVRITKGLAAVSITSGWATGRSSATISSRSPLSSAFASANSRAFMRLRMVSTRPVVAETPTSATSSAVSISSSRSSSRRGVPENNPPRLRAKPLTPRRSRQPFLPGAAAGACGGPAGAGGAATGSVGAAGAAGGTAAGCSERTSGGAAAAGGAGAGAGASAPGCAGGASASAAGSSVVPASEGAAWWLSGNAAASSSMLRRRLPAGPSGSCLSRRNQLAIPPWSPANGGEWRDVTTRIVTPRPGQGHMKRPPGKVRIIGGRWRGTRLPVADSAGLRPTSDRARETLFNWLQPVLPGARVLDLFAGSGALGIEALSRGAAQALLVERDPALATALEDSLRRLDAGPAARVVRADALAFLRLPVHG